MLGFPKDIYTAEMINLKFLKNLKNNVRQI